MSSYSRAVTLLRQASSILSEDMAAVDLYTLRADTMASPIGTMSDTTAATWRDVLAGVSPAFAEFARELTSLDIMFGRRIKATVRMQIVVWALQAVMLFVAFVLMCDIVRGARRT